MMNIKKLTAVAMAGILTLSYPLTLPVYADDDYEKDSISLETKIKKINKEGDLILDLSRKDLDKAGFSVGDEVKVKIKDYDYSEKMPYFEKDSDSEPDECALIINDDNAALSTSKGSFAEEEELFTPAAGKNNEILWKDDKGGSGEGKKVKIYLHDKGDFLEQYTLRNPERSNDRDDYSSGSKFANFREITSGTIGHDVLFRSSSPINDSIGRDEYSAKRMKKVGIKTVINLSDTKKTSSKYIKESKNAYYKELYDKGNVLCLGLDFDFDNKNFHKGMADAARFMSTHEGPYLIHCSEGKDRTGFMAALLESLMGASVSEMTDDYMTTYTNFYNYDDDSDEYEYVKKKYLKEIYRALAEVKKNTDLENMDYHAAAVKYLKNGGLSDIEINYLATKLKGDGSNDKRTIIINSDSAKKGTEGDYYSDKTGSAIAVYSGSQIRPGRSSFCLNGIYVYNGRDYKLSFDDNVKAGKMTVTARFKKKSGMYKNGVKKVVVYYTIAPKPVTESTVKVKLNKKKTGVKSVTDLDRKEKIKEKNYTVDMKKQEIVFKRNYSGKISIKSLLSA